MGIRSRRRSKSISKATAIVLTLGMMAIGLLPLAAVAQSASPKAPGTPKATSRKKTAVAKTSTVEELRQIREMIRQQQQQMQQQAQQITALQRQLEASQQGNQQAAEAATSARVVAEAASAKAAEAQTTASQTTENFTKLQSDMSDVKLNQQNAAVSTQQDQARVAAVEGTAARFRFGGDVRVRNEDFFFSCPTPAACHPRIRERIRVRFGFDGKLGEDFVGGIALASGLLVDPTTTNESLTSFFERKTIGIDRAYVTYNPQAHKWMTLTGGKFAYTWQRTPITFDSDLNPEGFSERFSYDVKNAGPVRNLAFTGMQLLFNESSNASGIGLNLYRGADSYSVGGQLSSKLQFFGDRWTMNASYGLLNWHNADVILNGTQALISAPNAFPASNPGALGVFAPNGNTNAVVFVPISGVGCATKVPSATCAERYLSQFLYSDLILANTVKTRWAQLPFNLTAEYEDNLNAADGQKDRHAYYAEASLGQQRDKHDLQFGYAFLRQEQDSVISSFNESDNRAPTNILQHRLFVQWKPSARTQLSMTDWIGRTLNSNLTGAVLSPGTLPGQRERFLKRLQFDVVYSF